MNLNPDGSPVRDLSGATPGTIKMSGFTFQKPDWTTEELDDE
jgi:hypothetical protein